MIRILHILLWFLCIPDILLLPTSRDGLSEFTWVRRSFPSQATTGDHPTSCGFAINDQGPSPRPLGRRVCSTDKGWYLFTGQSVEGFSISFFRVICWPTLLAYVWNFLSQFLFLVGYSKPHENFVSKRKTKNYVLLRSESK